MELYLCRNKIVDINEIQELKMIKKLLILDLSLNELTFN